MTKFRSSDNLFDLDGTGALQVPSGTTGERPGSPADGQLRFNTTNNEYEVYLSASWIALILGATNVISVFGRSGIVVADNDDYTASEITNAINGNIAATDVQAAINELDTEKGGLSLANTFTSLNTFSSGIELQDTNITRPNIVDYSVENNTPAISSGTLTLDITTGNDFDVSLTEDIATLTVSNWAPSGTFGKITIRLAQDGTGGRSVTFPAGWKWPSGTVPTLPTTANEDIELVVWSRDAGTIIYAAEVGQRFA